MLIMTRSRKKRKEIPSRARMRLPISNLVKKTMLLHQMIIT